MALASKKRSKLPRALSAGEELLSLHLTCAHISFEREVHFCPPRKFRADFRLCAAMVLIEVDGGVWTSGRHNRGSGYLKDCEKLNLAAEMGYRVLRYCTQQVESGEAINQIERIIDLSNTQKS